MIEVLTVISLFLVGVTFLSWLTIAVYFIAVGTFTEGLIGKGIWGQLLSIVLWFGIISLWIHFFSLFAIR